MWKPCFRTSHPSKSESWRCESQAFVRDSLEKWEWSGFSWTFRNIARRSFPIHSPRHALYCKTQNFVHPLTLKSACRPSKTASWRCENKAFVRDFPQKVKVVRHPYKTESWRCKMMLSGEASLKNWKLKMWKRSFCVRDRSETESWRCENDAFAQDVLQKLKVKTKLS